MRRSCRTAGSPPPTLGHRAAAPRSLRKFAPYLLKLPGGPKATRKTRNATIHETVTAVPVVVSVKTIGTTSAATRIVTAIQPTAVIPVLLLGLICDLLS